MAFSKNGSPEKIQVIDPGAVDSVICQRCGHVLIRVKGESKLIISGFGVMVTCNKCGEVTHGL